MYCTVLYMAIHYLTTTNLHVIPPIVQCLSANIKLSLCLRLVIIWRFSTTLGVLS